MLLGSGMQRRQHTYSSVTNNYVTDIYKTKKLLKCDRKIDKCMIVRDKQLWYLRDEKTRKVRNVT